MSDVYEFMATRGLCACPGGEQSVRVIPEALEFIRSKAAALPEAETKRVRPHAFRQIATMPQGPVGNVVEAQHRWLEQVVGGRDPAAPPVSVS
jgi:hypothetical protein